MGGGFGMGGFPISGFTSLDSREGFNEANSKIREAMYERGQMRRRKSGFSTDDSTAGDGSEEGWEEAKKSA